MENENKEIKEAQSAQKNQEIKNCENCKFFIRYYIKRNTKFSPVCCGVCNNKRSKKINKLRPSYSCGQWENGVVIKEQGRESLKKVLCRISKRLEEIAAVLNDDG